MTSDKQRTQAIQEWMADVVKSGGIERFEDLHIDQIDSDWNSKDRWIEGALTAQRIAMNLREIHGLRVTVAAAFSLRSDAQRAGLDFHTLNEFQERLDWTPPSLYLFHRGKEPWVGGADFQRLEDALFGNQRQGVVWWYTEFKPDGSAVYCRTVFCEG